MFFNVDGDVKKQMLQDLEVSRRERLEKMNLDTEEEKIVEMNMDTHMGTIFPQEDNEEASTDSE